jgi:signal transduction histidine kinase
VGLPGDILRLGFHVALLIGAALEIATYQRGLARAAVLDERRRVARQLHDGLAQELAFIVTQTRRLASKERSDKTLAYLATAGERALAESRHAIAALSQPADEPLDVAVERVADEIAHRAGMTLELNVTREVSVGVDAHEALLRIVREAMTNAARHGKARRVSVALSCEDGVHLRIDDDGVGFEPAEPTEPWRGLGLASMRERTEALGGSLLIDSRPGSGARIEVVLP